ncbi:hypothetical protein KF728_07225 [Candidatus Obscuribacterales bacterium]|nr:hypothetical protein [Candidatus Obscuribacterales bacterium]
MKREELERINAEMEAAGAALTRASKRARLLAARTRTEFVVVRDGKLVREIPSLEGLDDGMIEDSISLATD